MYEYHGYTITIEPDGVKITDSSGAYIGQCESDREAEDFIDRLENKMTLPTAKDLPKVYYLYRLPKTDRDVYSNYQYYDGKRFRYGASNIKYFSKEECEKLLEYYKRYSEYFLYRMAKGTR